MNNKVNILEEINKMKSLIRAKAGMVISEQDAGLDKDIEAFKDEIVNNAGWANNVDEKKLVDILKKYATDKNTFQNFLNKFQEKHGYNPTSIMAKSLDYSNDVEEINDLNSALSKIGLRYTNSGGIAKFEELSVVRQRNINIIYCSVKDGKISRSNSEHNGNTWSSYVTVYKVTPEEIAAAKATCPQVVVPDAAAPASDVAAPASNAAAPATDGKVPAETPKPTGPTPTQRLATTAKSLGVENPKMDVATLQTILNTLNQGPQGVTESKNSVNEELKMMKYLLGYQRGKVISEQDAPAATTPAPAATAPAATATPQQLIQQIQTVLKTKYNANLGNYGPNKDGIDSKWGNLTQTALDKALETIKSGKPVPSRSEDVAKLVDTAGTVQQAQQAAPDVSTIQSASQYAASPTLSAAQPTTPQYAGQPTSSATPAATTSSDIYTTLVNNKTLQSRDNGKKFVYKGADLPVAQRQELDSKLQGMGYRVSTVDNDYKQGDKIVFKKN
jgi:hypothetical protein